MNYRIDRLGRIKPTKQGFTAKVIEYRNRNNVRVEILETRERIWTDWHDFNKGKVVADLANFPFHTDCTFNQAKFYIVSITLLLLALGIGALIFKMI